MTNDTRKALTILVLNEFVVDVRLANNAICGSRFDGEMEAQARAGVRKLNEEGFVFHNTQFIAHVQDFFDNPNAKEQPMFKASCEELAHGVARLLIDFVGLDRVEFVMVRVRNETGWAEVRWAFGEELPELPRLATPDEKRETIDNPRESRC
jgi:hypothetical protein